MNEWIKEEFKNCEFGDKRLINRAEKILENRMSNSRGSIPECSQEKKEMKATYRFFENEYFNHRDILKGHKMKTEEKIKSEKIVLSLQDSMSIDFTRFTKTEGLGILEGKGNKGIMMHTTIAVTPEKKVLGIIEQKLWARKSKEERNETRDNSHIPIEEKESYRWIESLKETNKIQKKSLETLIVNIGDRETDIYEYFHEAEELNQKVLARTHYDRKIFESESRMIEYISGQKPAGEIKVEIKKTERRDKRTAVLEVRFAQVTLKPPKKYVGKKLSELRVTIIIAKEIVKENDKSFEPINWILTTNMEISNFEDACEKIRWYSIRWQIELFHKILKSGCKIEERRLGKAENLMKYLSLDSIVALRILNLAMSESEEDELFPCTEIFSYEEWQALHCFENKTKELRKEAPTIKEIRMSIAKLGGFLGRKCDGKPGITVMWRGLQKLAVIVEAWNYFG